MADSPTAGRTAAGAGAGRDGVLGPPARGIRAALGAAQDTSGAGYAALGALCIWLQSAERRVRRAAASGARGSERSGPHIEPFGYCPGREPPFLAVKRPARPYKSAVANRFT